MTDMGAEMALSRATLRILRGRTPEQVERSVRHVRTESLWGTYELLLLVGHVEGAGHKLVSDTVATELERSFVSTILATSGGVSAPNVGSQRS